MKNTTGKVNYSWVEYETMLSENRHVQVILWPNGDGLDIHRPDDTIISMGWDEWEATKKAVNLADKVK
jgi:hypothetical protein